MRTLFVVRIGNLPYFLFILFLFGVTALSSYLCNKLGKQFAFRYLSIILWANFGLHFLKQLLPHFLAQFPYGLADSAFPNLCAVLIVLAPFIFHFGNDYLKDYFYYIGFISGVLVYLVPTGAMRTDLAQGDYYFETFRFYFCHWPLVVGSLLMVSQGFHKLDWKRLWAIPLMFCAILAIIAIDQIFFGPVMKLPGYPYEWVGEHGVLNRMNVSSAYSNQSMQFGPQPGVDGILGWLYPALIPGLMTYYVGGEIYFTPVIWIMPFIYIGAAILGPLLTLPFERKAMRADILGLRQKMKMRAFHRREGR